MTSQKLCLVGSAFGLGAKNHGTARGPIYLRDSYALHEKLSECYWGDVVQNHQTPVFDERGHNYDAVLHHNRELAHRLKSFLSYDRDHFVTVIGGDHSGALGTWSALASTHQCQSEFGLIWIDAHMDANTLYTSPSKAYHGMPLSHLLGIGDPELCTIGGPSEKLNPKHLVLIGVRSFDEGENIFLRERGVTIFSMIDIARLGLENVIAQSIDLVTDQTKEFGISIDIDAFDPKDAPGTGALSPEGIRFDDFKGVMPMLFSHRSLSCLEIAEFNPMLDQDDKTANLIYTLLSTLQLSRL